MKVQIIENSCHRQGLKVTRLRHFLLGNGYALAGGGEDATSVDPTADVIILTTCGFIKKREDLNFELLELIQTLKKPSARVILGGCLLQLNPGRVSKDFSGPSFASDAYQDIENFLAHDRPYDSFPEPNQIHSYASHFVQIQVGCPDRCAYCALWKTMPEFRSKPIPDILEEVQRGLREGRREICLLGECAGAYGHDLGSDLGDLLGELAKLDDAFSLILEDISPKYFDVCFEELLALCLAGKVKSLHSPIQSGNARILGLMKRGHDMGTYQEQIRALRDAAPGMSLATAIIIGFPSETWGEFIETVEYCEIANFTTIKCHLYSDHDGTESFQIAGKVSAEDARKRYDFIKQRLGGRIAN